LSRCSGAAVASWLGLGLLLSALGGEVTDHLIHSPPLSSVSTLSITPQSATICRSIWLTHCSALRMDGCRPHGGSTASWRAHGCLVSGGAVVIEVTLDGGGLSCCLCGSEFLLCPLIKQAITSHSLPTTPNPTPNTKGGIYDTKYISRQLPDVFGRDTALSDVYSALVEGDKAVAVAALMAAAGEAGGQLPVIKHAGGCDKYRCGLGVSGPGERGRVGSCLVRIQIPQALHTPTPHHPTLTPPTPTPTPTPGVWPQAPRPTKLATMRT